MIKKLSLDFDDLIVDTQKHFCDMALNTFGINLNISNAHQQKYVLKHLTPKEYSHLMEQLSYSTEIPIIMGARENINKLKNLEYSLQISTARDSKESKIAKIICENNGIDIPIFYSNYQSKKILCKDAYAHIDDMMEYLRELIPIVPNLLLFDRLHNQNEIKTDQIKRTKSWENIYNYFAEKQGRNT
ncbi:MAG: hypothetical protein PF542_04330 [Nanoarchaeota archaeon]|jgi:hypothetical protein|nr:hypothetical protein [Nanoarchaeota archaeon]